MSVLELNLAYDPVNTILTLIACLAFTLMVVGTFLMFILKFIFIILTGFKAAKGINEEVNKKRK